MSKSWPLSIKHGSSLPSSNWQILKAFGTIGRFCFILDTQWYLKRFSSALKVWECRNGTVMHSRCITDVIHKSYFPHRLENMENGSTVFHSGKSKGILNIRVILPKILEKWGNFSQFYFYHFSDFLTEVYLLNRFLFLLNVLNKRKNTENEENTGKSQGIC